MPEESNIKQLLTSVTTSLDEDFDDFEPIKTCANQLNTKPSYLILGIVGLVFIVTLLTNVVAYYVITLFALIYPAYMSFKVK